MTVPVFNQGGGAAPAAAAANGGANGGGPADAAGAGTSSQLSMSVKELTFDLTHEGNWHEFWSMLQVWMLGCACVCV